ncbi:MAG: MFS transporter [Anaerolineaceae bacterium]|nr:MFS transporter [Anaerolineaceae bacterium]
MTAVTGPQKRLSLSTKVIYGLASLGTSTVSSIYGALLPIFYQDYLGLSSKWIGIASAIYAIWNALNDPIFGFITDNTRSKLGRRIPYMRFTAPFLALTFILVWFAPEGAGEIAQFWWMLVTMLLYDTAYTIIGLVYGALMPELTESDVERNQLTISSTLFGLVGYVLGFVLPDLFRPRPGNEASSLMGLQMSMIAVGIICAFLVILTTLKVKERREFAMVDRKLKFWESLGYTLTNKPFWVFVSMNFLITFMMAIATGSLYYLADYVTQTSTMLLMVYLFVPMVIGVPLANLAVKKVGLLTSQIIYMVICGIGLLTIGFVPVSLIPVSLIISGVGLSGQQSITYNILGLVIDADEVRTGTRREGSFFGANALLTKPAQSLALFLTAFILERGGFITRAVNDGQILLDQPATAIFGIRAIVGLIPGIAMLIGAVIILFFPIKGQQLTELKEKIMVMHAEKKAAFDALEAESVSKG